MPSYPGGGLLASAEAKAEYNDHLKQAVENIGGAATAASNLHAGVSTLHHLTSQMAELSGGVNDDAAPTAHIHELLSSVEQNGKTILGSDYTPTPAKLQLHHSLVNGIIDTLSKQSELLSQFSTHIDKSRSHLEAVRRMWR
jgi:hypothetical protein